MSSDPAMDGINWYGYVGGNALGAVDPLGLTDVIVYSRGDGDPRWDLYDSNNNTTIDKHETYKAKDNDVLWKIADNFDYNNWQEAAEAAGIRDRFNDNGTYKNGIEKTIKDVMFSRNPLSKEAINKIKNFMNELNNYVDKYTYYGPSELPDKFIYTLKSGVPSVENTYIISDGDNAKHKERTYNGGEGNYFVSDYDVDEGYPIYTTSEQVFTSDSAFWSYGQKDKSPNRYGSKAKNNLKTYGTGFGYQVVSTSPDGKFEYRYAHTQRTADSTIAKDFSSLLGSAKSAGVTRFTLPRGVAIGTIGMTGDGTGPHLHYEIRLLK